MLSSEDTAHIPVVLKGQTYYDVSADKGYEALYRHLTNQPLTLKPTLGKLKSMSPLKAQHAEASSLNVCSIEKKRCFVIMPFGKKGTAEYDRNLSIYQDIIKPVVKECGYEAIRADEMEYLGNITRDIIEHLHESDLVVADLSGKNANVFYELGVRHALYRSGTIPVIREGETLPFDIANYRAIFYSIELKGPEQFKKELKLRIKAFEKLRWDKSDNPVHDILGDKLCIPDLKDYILLTLHQEKLNERLKENETFIKEIKTLKSENIAKDNQLKSITKEKEALEKAFLDKKAYLENRIKELEEEIARLNQVQPQKPQPDETFTNSLNMTFVYIPPGTFMMGSPKYESGRYDDETLHEVMLTQGFYLQSTPVTQGQWKAVMGNNPSNFKDCGDDCPVENVSWNDVQKFIKKVNDKEGKTYRLPTEAEWEYACRAGSTTRYCFGDDEGKLSEYAWYSDNAGGRTHPLGTKKPNDRGLYDMHGNVWEWCEDWYGDYPSGKVIDPAGPSSGSGRVIRGGSWSIDARLCWSASRSRTSPGDRYVDVGFRLSFF